MKFLHLNFIPRSTDAALLLLRVWAGASLLLLHGWGKLTGFSAMSSKFPDLFGIGQAPTLALAAFGEAVCSTMLIVGLFTRFAALGCGITMAVAFTMAHKGALSGSNSGELAFIYLGAFLTLFLAGAGKFSVDARIGAKT